MDDTQNKETTKKYEEELNNMLGFNDNGDQKGSARNRNSTVLSPHWQQLDRKN